MLLSIKSRFSFWPSDVSSAAQRVLKTMVGFFFFFSEVAFERFRGFIGICPSSWNFFLRVKLWGCILFTGRCLEENFYVRGNGTRAYFFTRGNALFLYIGSKCQGCPKGGWCWNERKHGHSEKLAFVIWPKTALSEKKKKKNAPKHCFLLSCKDPTRFFSFFADCRISARVVHISRIGRAAESNWQKIAGQPRKADQNVPNLDSVQVQKTRQKHLKFKHGIVLFFFMKPWKTCTRCQNCFGRMIWIAEFKTWTNLNRKHSCDCTEPWSRSTKIKWTEARTCALTSVEKP